MALVVGSATDLGRRRQQNEDSFVVWSPAGEADRARRGALLVVADGMGGAAAGEVASRMAVETVLERYRGASEVPPLAALKSALEEANRRVHRESLLHPEYRGMGTTCTAAVVRDAAVTIAHVGDSRAYLARGDALRPLTRDHTLVAQLVSEGRLTAEESRTDSRRNVVTRCIGVSESIEVDAEEWGEILEAGTVLVLCTDGLHGVVDERELASAATGVAPDIACHALVALANERGGPDNITVIVARADAPAPPPAVVIDAGAEPTVSPAPAALAAPVAPRDRWPLATLMVLGGLVVLLALVLTLVLRTVR